MKDMSIIANKKIINKETNEVRLVVSIDEENRKIHSVPVDEPNAEPSIMDAASYDRRWKLYEEPVAEAPKTEDKPITKTDIRAVALKLSKAGKQKELADIFAKFGCKKLSDFDSRTEDYPALMKELVSVNG